MARFLSGVLAGGFALATWPLCICALIKYGLDETVDTYMEFAVFLNPFDQQDEIEPLRCTTVPR